jgi:poly(A) polymerase
MLVDGADRRWVSQLLGMTGRTNDAQMLADWDIPEMPLKGRDLLAAGLKHGRHIGPILSEAKQIWVASRFTASCADLLETVLADGAGWTPPTP